MSITVKDNLGIPKYRQIIISVEKEITNGNYKRGDKLPSINSIRNRFSLSRDTVLLAYNDLKTRGIVQSFPGKGYYVKSEKVNTVQKIFVLFDELNAFKEDLYNSFLKRIDNNIEVDIYFHHFNFDVFNKLIYDNIGNYNYYVIMPANLKHTNTVINKLPQDKVYILDQMHPELMSYNAIFQNFKENIQNGLSEGISLIKKYKEIILLFSEAKQPQGMLNGFESFCKQNNLKYQVIESLINRQPKKGEVYLIPDDRNLLRIIKSIKLVGLKLGQDIGVISYNDTLLKEIVEGGITTISTDFNAMGERLAKMILNHEKVQIENSFKFILRNSL